ncbi:MAG: class I mannose-6-phosphate isomerase [Candidatus Omnitrophica bacterium]|nr:class I mannose-6-phosphate isomerase [Candidatus Omnitrophota bacterium]
MKLPKSYKPSDMINRPNLSVDLNANLWKGFPQISEAILSPIRNASNSNGASVIAIDSHLGFTWDPLLQEIRKEVTECGAKLEVVDLTSVLKTASSIEKMLKPYLPEDPVFGKIFEGGLWDFFDKRKLASLQKKIETFGERWGEGRGRNLLLVHGPGAGGLADKKFYRSIVYVDLCREEILKRLKLGYAYPLGAPKPEVQAPSRDSDKPALPAYFSTRRLYYVDYAVLDSHRKSMLKKMDFYVDGNDLDTPKMLSKKAFRNLFNRLMASPIKPKPYYDPGPWGGEWLKKVRKLPKDMINCAWSYDLIEPETSFEADLEGTILEFPFPVLTAFGGKKLLGKLGSKKKYAGQFPIRINYDDSYHGDDMALQSHPDDAYIGNHFNEPFRQDESYYLVDTAPGSKVYLGLKEETDYAEFRRLVERAEKDLIPFDHNQYVNSIPSKPGDLFLIPAGTIHGSGKGNTVLEISATTYRYTLHFYDYLRPGLDGNLRAIHSKEAFDVLDQARRTNWVLKNLKQKPRKVRGGKGWDEFLIGKRDDMFFEVRRLEFLSKVEEDTAGEFHLLIPVVGERITIEPRDSEGDPVEVPFSCLGVIPAAMGRYRIRSTKGDPCQVVKVIMAT